MKKRFLGLVFVGIFCFGFVGCAGENGDYRKLYEEERAKWWIEKDRNDKLDEENEELLRRVSLLEIEKVNLERYIEEKDGELNYYHNNISPYLRLGDELAAYISDNANASVCSNLIQIYVQIDNFDDEVLYDTLYECVYNMLDKVYKLAKDKGVIVFVKFMDNNGSILLETTINKYRVTLINNKVYDDLIYDVFDKLMYLMDSGEGVTRNWRVRT